MGILRKIFKRLHLYTQKPGELFRYGSPKLRSIYNSLCKLIFIFHSRKERIF